MDVVVAFSGNTYGDRKFSDIHGEEDFKDRLQSMAMRCDREKIGCGPSVLVV